LEGDLAKGPARLLVTATGYAENTGMKWKGDRKDSVGDDWGKAPSLVEGIPVGLTLAEKAVKAWVLDERGRHKAALSVQAGKDGKATLRLGPRRETLWYEIELK